MLDYLKDFYKKLLSSVLDPVAHWILALSWKYRVLILAAAAAGLMAWQKPVLLHDIAAYSGRFFRVVTADAHSIPFTPRAKDRIASARARLIVANSNDVNLIDTGDLTGWSAAQTLLSLGRPGTPDNDEAKLLRYIRTKRVPACYCWAELNHEDEKRAWTFISGWVMAALAHKRQPPAEEELRFLLAQQNPDGSWAPIPQKGLTEYESVAATSWAITGLHRLVETKLIPDTDLAMQAKSAVKRGTAWLLSTRQPEARWKSYPYLRSSTVSPSLSGLALHTLHLAGQGDMAEIDKAWLDHIPASPIPASLGENYNIEIKKGGTLQIDYFTQLTMPWMLIATVDAYDNGGVIQKTRALAWMEETLLHDSVKNADAEQGNWWRAELLIALNYLHERLQPKPPSPKPAGSG